MSKNHCTGLILKSDCYKIDNLLNFSKIWYIKQRISTAVRHEFSYVDSNDSLVKT